MTDSDLRCRKILFLVCFTNDFICPKCDSREFYVGSKFELICRDCVFKSEATRNTMFHDTRIGLNKFFEICMEYKRNGYEITCKVLKSKYNLSEKTGYRIIGKLKNNQTFIDKISDKYYIEDSILENKIKRIKDSIKMRNYFKSKSL